MGTCTGWRKVGLAGVAPAGPGEVKIFWKGSGHSARGSSKEPPPPLAITASSKSLCSWGQREGQTH